MKYTKIIQDYFFSPQYIGMLDCKAPFTVFVRSYQTNWSLTVIELYLRCDEKKTITEISYKARGTPYVIAVLEWLCRKQQGKTLELLPIETRQQVINELSVPYNQYPIVVQILELYKEIVVLMEEKFERVSL